jgi:hypothetical protein
MGSLKLNAVGDIWLRTGHNRHPFAQVDTLLHECDILFGNLETTLSDEGEPAKKHHVISVPPERAAYLKEAGFDILSVANNHTLDRGAEGFTRTLHTLDENGIAHAGGSAPGYPDSHAILERHGITVGFLAYTIGRGLSLPGASVNRLVEGQVLSDIRSLADTCDHVAVSMHWGSECVYYPSPGQIRLAHRCIDAGASLVLGHHPHTMQAIERYHGGLIAYSLGLFQWDPYWPHGISNESFILSVQLEPDSVGNYTLTPIVVDDDYVPDVAIGRQREKILAFVDDVSRPVINGEVTGRRWFEEASETYLRMNWESYRERIRRHGIVPLAECGVWLVTPFCLRCYAGLIRKRLRLKLQSGSSPPQEGEIA